MEDRIRAIMAGLLDAIDEPGGFDLIAAVAQPLPIIVIAEMLGVPPEDGDRFKLWSAQRARLLEPTVSRRDRARAQDASQEFDAYFGAMIERRRSEPRARASNITGKALTPFLLDALAESSGGATLRTNRALLVDNARAAAEVARHLAVARPRDTHDGPGGPGRGD